MFVVDDSAALPPPARIEELPSLEGDWIRGKPLRERSLLALMLTQEAIRSSLVDGPIVEVRASADNGQDSLLPFSAVVRVNAADSKEAQRTIRSLKHDLATLFIHNALQYLSETRQFLGLCFSKLAVGGMLVISVPHQFLYERKLRLPSRRTPSHRRFYTSNTLLADVEEAIDPSEFRVRFLGESDAGFPYREGLGGNPGGGQDILLAVERLERPPWRSAMDDDEIWTGSPTKPPRFLPLERNTPVQTRIVAPDPLPIHRIVVVKMDHRGDYMMATDAFEALRNGFPTAELTLVCGSWNAGEAERSGYFNEVIPFDFFAEDDSARTEMPPREALIADFGKRMAGRSFDLAVDLRLYDDTRELLRKIDARHRAGFDRYDDFPWLDVRFNTPSASDDDRGETGVIPANSFHTSRASGHKAYEILFDEAFTPGGPQSLIWGPYQQLKPGKYQLECLIEPLAEDFELGFDIVKDHGKTTVAAGVLPIRRKQNPVIDLNVSERIPEFELRLLGRQSVRVHPFRFRGLRYTRPGIFRGVHQREAMVLLAHLVQLRMRDAYTTELA